MNITFFGAGYVGLVSAACLAEKGHSVVCIDLDIKKISDLNSGILPIWEPGLDSLVQRNLKSGRLFFTTDEVLAINHGKAIFIAVGTPSDEDGSADTKYVLNVAKQIGRNMTGYKLIVNKSTVPVGTAEAVTLTINEILSNRSKISKDKKKFQLPQFDVVSNPEFLKEGDAVNDFLKPNRIVIGSNSERSSLIMNEIYEPFNRNHDIVMFMKVRSAELSKYAANAMLAAKISFMNEISNLADVLKVDVEEVRLGIGSDPRIGYHFIYPGCGYGGSCFPKDVQALERMARNNGYQAELLLAVEAVNNRQKNILFKKIENHFGGPKYLFGKTIAIWGLSFKPKTDDMREAPSRALIQSLLNVGAKIQAYDPVAMNEASSIYKDTKHLKIFPDQYSVLENADVLAICTEWDNFRSPDFDKMSSKLKTKTIFDGRNMYSPEKLKNSGWNYLSIGRNT
jgi:UDPglucose 6-dehydrogenase